MDVDNDENDVMEMGEEELDDELELPHELANLSVKEKRNLLIYKRSHNEIEYEEEIVRRTADLARSTDFERLKRLTQSKDKSTNAKAKTTGSAAKKSKDAVIPDSDEEEDEEEDLPKKRGQKAKPAPKASKAKGKGRGRRQVVESESEEEEDAEEEEEDEDQEKEEKVAGDEDDEEEEDEDEDDEEEEEEEEESDDDLFDSEEEEEITKRGRTATADDDDEEGGNRKSKKLRKGGRKSSKSRSAWDDEEEEDDEEDDDDDDDDNAMDEDDNDEGGNQRRKAAGRGNRVIDDHKYREDGDLGRIKSAFRTNRQKEADQQRSDRQQSAKPKVFNTLEEYKRHLLQRGIEEKDTGKGYIRETTVALADDDKELAEYPDYMQIFLRREEIARILQEPYFDAFIEGCFVKYLMDASPAGGKPTYRACQIVGVGRTERAYKIPASKGEVETKVILKLNTQGVTVDRKRLDKVSNHTLSEEEVNKHITGLVQRHIQPLTKREIRLKRQRMRDYQKSYVYSNEEIQAMIAARTGLNKVFATDYTTALAELQKTLTKATTDRNFELMEITQKEIEKLNYENERQKKVYEKTYKVHADVNRKMRELNTKRDMEAGMRKRREDQQLAAEGKLSNSITDPFIRRETRPKNLWISNSKRPLGDNEAVGGNSETANNDAGSNNNNNSNNSSNKKSRFGVEDDAWPIPLVVDLNQMRKKLKKRLGVDPLEDVALDKQARHLKKVMRSIPPKGSAERELLRGSNRSLQEYLEQLHAEEAA